MPRTQISIKLDEDLLTRVDQLAEAAGTNRTAVIEQAIKNDLPQQEDYQRSLENPIVRAIHKQITTPRMLQAIAKIVNEDMTEEERAELLEKAARQRDAAERRIEDRKGKGRKPKEDDA